MNDIIIFICVTVLIAILWICNTITESAKIRAKADIKVARINATANLVSEGRIAVPTTTNWNPEFLVED